MYAFKTPFFILLLSCVVFPSTKCATLSISKHFFVSQIPFTHSPYRNHNDHSHSNGITTHIFPNYKYTHLNAKSKARESPLDSVDDQDNYLGTDEYGLRIPKFHPDIEKVKSNLRHFGPEIPGELWMSPERPVGYFGKRRLDPWTQFTPARRAIVIRARRRKYMSTIYRNVRKTYKRYIRDSRSYGELMYWRYKLDSLPKDSAPTKFHNFCPLSGRFRAYYGFFGLGRHPLRDLVNLGYVPGVKPANW